MIVTQKDFPIALTFDIDWAPDFAIEACLEILEKFSIPATFFATHPSPLLEEIKKKTQFEVGIHPNFLSGTTHGKSMHEIMEHMMELVPSAVSLRTHSLFQSSPLYFYILEAYKQIKYDFSLFLPSNPFLVPFSFANEAGDSILRIPYQWEDDILCLQPLNSRNNLIFSEATYQILNFHPIHVFLNSFTLENYHMLKKNLTCPLWEVEKKQAIDYLNLNQGTRTYLINILNNLSSTQFVLASQIPQLIEKREPA